MTLSEELQWRGFVNQTTYKDVTALDGDPIAFYWGVDPSADSMQVGNLAIAMMVHHFIDHGHKAYLLVGGATGMIGDPDGKSQERDLLSLETISSNKAAIAAQYQQIFKDMPFEIVDNYDWFKDMNYLSFLRDVGKHVPMRQMLGREFVQSRLGEESVGLSYAEFSYALIQGYDFLHLHKTLQVDLQVCGADQWGNCIAGVELIRRVTGDEAHIWSGPLVVNKTTGVKFGKSEGGAVWLDAKKTSPTQFYQFWINVDDNGVADYLKIYTLLSKEEVGSIMEAHTKSPHERLAQLRLAEAVTMIVHGAEQTRIAQAITDVLNGKIELATIDETIVGAMRSELAAVSVEPTASVLDVLVEAGLAPSQSEARRLLSGNAIAINGLKIEREQFEVSDFKAGRLLLRRGKAFKDSALVELKT
jgi:tyrosyl-tRNA synthetase